jgi:hypothetical protein
MVAAGLTVMFASPSQAECIGPDCYDGLAAVVLGVLGYVFLALAIAVMLIRHQWRGAGFKLLATVVVVAMSVPLMSQAWHAWKRFSMERREVVGQPPEMSGRVPLLIMLDPDCYGDACAALLFQRGNSGAYVLPSKALNGVDLTQPLRLSDLALEQWAAVAGQDTTPRRRTLSPAERQAAAARMDYLVIVSQPYPQAKLGPIEAALRTNPALGGMRAGEIVHLALAPIDPAQGQVSFADLQFDLLDLSLSAVALAFPLAPYHWQPMTNTTAGSDLVARSFCPTPDGRAEVFCLNALE